MLNIQAPDLMDTTGRYELQSSEGIQGVAASGSRPAHFVMTSATGGARFELISGADFNRIEIGVIGYLAGGQSPTDGVLASFTDSDGLIVELFTRFQGQSIGIRTFDPNGGSEKGLAEFSDYTFDDRYVFGFEVGNNEEGEPLYQPVLIYTYPAGQDPASRTVLYEGNDIFGLNAESVAIGARTDLPERIANVGSWILGITGVYLG